MVTISSCTWPLLLAFCCWCCMTLIEGARESTLDFKESGLSTNKGKLCRNHVQNEDETDIDCGGINCPKCGDWKSCKSNCDCINGVCKNGECLPLESCEDNIKNQDETDIDCGGTVCPKCKDTNSCKKNCDCVDGVCEDNTCVVSCVPKCKNNGKCIGKNKCSCPAGFSGPICESGSNGLCSTDDTLGSKPILLTTFGAGFAQYSKYTPSKFGFSTTYKQRFEPNTDDGHFSLVNSIHDDFSGAWHTGATDHTGNEGGYMFLVNADYNAGQFYNRTVNHLCVGQRYEFSVYLANICKPSTSKIKPNILFQVRTTIGNDLLVELKSGDVPEYNTLTWQKYGLSFIATKRSVVLLMISKAPGGIGNDLALDDIALRVCGEPESGFCY